MSEVGAQEVMDRRRRRGVFLTYLIVVFLLFSAAAWLVMPTMLKTAREVADMADRSVPRSVQLLFTTMTLFKLFWIPCAIGTGILAVLGAKGLLDGMIPVLNLLLVLLGAGLIVLCFLSYFLPTILLTSSLAP